MSIIFDLSVQNDHSCIASKSSVFMDGDVSEREWRVYWREMTKHSPMKRADLRVRAVHYLRLRFVLGGDFWLMNGERCSISGFCD